MAAHTMNRERQNIKIAVASHKPYWTPADPMYIPVQVGAIGKPSIAGFERDDRGSNISSKNPRYCELTALYWAVNNIDAEYIGLAHYRRHFSGSGDKRTMSSEDAANLLARAPVILPKRRNYYIETLGSHYAHTHDRQHLEALGDVIAKMAPAYSADLYSHLSERGGHMFNMMVMRRDLLEEFCSWMFPILFETECHIRFDGLSPFQERLMGRLSELLVDVWVGHFGLDYVEQPIVEMERASWVKKGGAFLAAKAFGKGYEASF